MIDYINDNNYHYLCCYLIYLPRTGIFKTGRHNMHVPVILQQPGLDTLSPENRLPEIIITDTPPSPVKRFKLWGLSRAYHCPIIGLCLSSADLERFAKRFHFNAPLNNAHALHVEAVCRVASRSRVAETIH